MIDYAALAESASVILTIYFIAVGAFMQLIQRTGMLPYIVYVYRGWAVAVFVPFTIAIIMALMNIFYSILFFIASMIVLGIALEKLFSFIIKVIKISVK